MDGFQASNSVGGSWEAVLAVGEVGTVRLPFLVARRPDMHSDSSPGRWVARPARGSGLGRTGAPALGAGQVLAALWSPGEALQLLSLLSRRGRRREPFLTVGPGFTLEPHSLKGHVNTAGEPL